MREKVFSPRTLLMILATYLVEVSVLPVIFQTTLRLSLTYLLILYVAFKWHWKKSIPVALLIGLLHDSTSSLPFGVISASLVFACLILNFAIQKIERYFLLMQVLTTFLFVLGVFWLQALFVFMLGSNMPSFGHALQVSFLGSLVACLIMPFFFSVSMRWFKDQAYLKA